jgi:iron complex outermembrane receptor protein
MSPSSPKTRRATAIHAAVLALIGSMGAAQAQTTPAAAASAPATDAKPAATDQVITITATKRSTSLQRTPVAVTALSATTLEDNHVQNILDAVSLVPSFQATGQGDHGVITMTMRGIGNDSAKTEYADPEVALFIDGIYSPRPEGAATLLFDLEGIEVLRGPQGTLWGRNSTVGAVNIKTAKPTLGDNSGNFEGGVGSYNRIGLRGAFNVPLGNTAALRFSFVQEKRDGYVDYQAAPRPTLASQQAAYAASNNGSLVGFQPLNQNLFVQGGPKYNAQDQSAARISLLWKPTADLRLDLSYEKFKDRGTPSMSLMQTPRPGEKFWSALIDTAPSLKRDTDSIRAQLEYQLSPGLALTYIGGLSTFSGSGTFDQDLGSQVPTSFATGANHQEDNTVWSRYKSQSHELSVQSTGKQALDWILGLYYAAEDNGIRFDIPIFNGTQQGTAGWQGSFIQPKETVDASAVFGQTTFNASDALHFTLGARYSHDDRKNIGGRGWFWAYDNTVPQVPLNPGLDPTKPGSGFTAGSINDGHYTGSKTTYLARVNYELSPTNMVYASVATGYKSGGLQDGGLPYGPETLTSYELGSKMTLMDGALRLNTALYRLDFKDFQFSAPITNPDGTRGLATSNAEGAKVTGLEVELAARLTPADRVQVAFAYTRAKLGKLIAGTNDYTLPACPVAGISTCLDVSGNTMPHAPKLATTVQYSHTFTLADGTLTPRISLRHESAQWLSVFNLGDGDRQKAYTRTDIGLRYAASKGWYADAFVRNVEDGKVKTSAGLNGTIFNAQYMPPRMWGLNVGTNF